MLNKKQDAQKKLLPDPKQCFWRFGHSKAKCKHWRAKLNHVCFFLSLVMAFFFFLRAWANALVSCLNLYGHGKAFEIICSYFGPFLTFWGHFRSFGKHLMSFIFTLIFVIFITLSYYLFHLILFIVYYFYLLLCWTNRGWYGTVAWCGLLANAIK